MKTETVRAGAVNSPVLASYVDCLTVASEPAAWTGCSRWAVPASAGTRWAWAVGVALNTTTRSPRVMVITPRVSSLPEIGKASRDWTASVVARAKSGSVVRIRSRSR